MVKVKIKDIGTSNEDSSGKPMMVREVLLHDESEDQYYKWEPNMSRSTFSYQVGDLIDLPEDAEPCASPVGY